MTDIADELDEVLLRGGADLGRPDKRRARAARLALEGLTVADLEELLEWGHATRKRVHTVGAFLSWVTHSRAQWHAFLAQIRLMKADRSQRLGVIAATAPAPKPSPETDPLYLRGMAYARVRADRVPPERVAAELGITVDDVHCLIEAEEASRPPRPVHDAPAKPAPRLSAREIRAQLAAERGAQPTTTTEDDEIW